VKEPTGGDFAAYVSNFIFCLILQAADAFKKREGICGCFGVSFEPGMFSAGDAVILLRILSVRFVRSACTRREFPAEMQSLKDLTGEILLLRLANVRV
jgi:hypothetical protein